MQKSVGKVERILLTSIILVLTSCDGYGWAKVLLWHVLKLLVPILFQNVSEKKIAKPYPLQPRYAGGKQNPLNFSDTFPSLKFVRNLSITRKMKLCGSFQKNDP